MSIKTILKVIPAPQEHWVGNGFFVSGFFNTFEEINSPFLLLDYARPKHFTTSNMDRGVGSHPHRGFETVTIALKGEITHKDSTGKQDTIKEGDVQWMTAGSGIIHQEFFSDKFNSIGGELQMLQLWINLPKEFKMVKPHYQAISSNQIPVVELEEVKVKVIAGQLNQVKGVAQTYSPIKLFVLEMQKGATWQLELEESWTSLILNIEGEVIINDSIIPTNHLIQFNKSGTTIEFQANSQTTMIILSGQPLGEPIAHYGPFVMNTREELVQAVNDFNSGRFGQI